MKVQEVTKGVALALGQERYSKEWQENVLVPKMLNKEYLAILDSILLVNIIHDWQLVIRRVI